MEEEGGGGGEYIQTTSSLDFVLPSSLTPKMFLTAYLTA